MKKQLLVLFTGVTLLAGGTLVVSAGVAEAQSSTEADTEAGLRVADLKVEEEHGSGYSRDKFRHWVDADSDGCDTRKEVLKAESLTVPMIGDRCTLSGGHWVSWYDGEGEEVQGSGSGLDVDHMVPLKEAWGGHSSRQAQGSGTPWG